MNLILFLISLGIFSLVALFLKINLFYLLGVVLFLVLGKFSNFRFLAFLSLIPFSLSLFQIKSISFDIDNLFLFFFGFLFQFLFSFLISLSKKEKIDFLFLSLISCLFLFFFFYLFLKINFGALSLLSSICFWGVLILILILVFFKIQYLLWKKE